MRATHESRCVEALQRLRGFAGKDYMKLHFKHLTSEEIEGYEAGEATDPDLRATAQGLTRRLQQEDLQLKNYKHSGYKDFTEGPSADTPILLRQDAVQGINGAGGFHGSGRFHGAE